MAQRDERRGRGGSSLEPTTGKGTWKRGRESWPDMENPVASTCPPQPKRNSPYLLDGSRHRPRHPPFASPDSFGLQMNTDWESQANTWRIPSALPKKSSWAEPEKVWSLMVEKSDEHCYARLESRDVFGVRHPDLAQPRIRAILLDWIIDVCEVYKLHRETFYLAVDFVDRYLSKTPHRFTRSRLQLLGITALFAAAKLEEIYPPKCEEFAYVTDQACTDQEIRHMELELMQVLEWRLSPITSIQWLRLFLQLYHLPLPQTNNFQCSAGLSADPACLLKPQFQREVFLAMVKLLDAAILQEESMGIHYGVLAAAVFVSLMDVGTEEGSTQVSEACGVPLVQLRSAIEFMRPTVELLETPQLLPPLLLHHYRRFPRTPEWDDVPADDAHNIQTRDASLVLYDIVNNRKAALASVAYTRPQNSPSLPQTAFPTPPPSNERPTTPAHLLDITNNH